MRHNLLKSLQVGFDLLFLLASFKSRSFKFYVYPMSDALCMTTDRNEISIRIWGLKKSSRVSGFLVENNPIGPSPAFVDAWLSTEDAAVLINSVLIKREINE